MVTLTIVVRNDGGGDASSVVVRAMDVTETPVQVGDDVTIPTIAAGGSMTVTLVYDTTDKQGSRSLTVSADPDNTITESNENDNTATVTIPIGEGTPESATSGQSSGDESAAAPAQPGEDDEASVDTLDPRQELPTGELNIEVAEDLNLRD
jgi:hypothetical protein